MDDQSFNSFRDFYGPLPPHSLINGAQTFGALRNAEERIMQYGGTTANVMSSINLKRKEIALSMSLQMINIYGVAAMTYTPEQYHRLILGQMCNNISFEEAEMVRRYVIAYYRNWQK